MLSPLVTWVSSAGETLISLTDTVPSNVSRSTLSVDQVKTFVPQDGDVHLDFSELLDGVFLIDMMTQM